MASPPKSISAEQRLEVDVALLHLAELQQLGLLEGEQARQDHVGKLLDAHVVEVDRLVVKLATIGNRILQAGDALLQMLKALIGLEIRIAFGQREQLAKAATQAALGLAQSPDIVLLAG